MLPVGTAGVVGVLVQSQCEEAVLRIIWKEANAVCNLCALMEILQPGGKALVSSGCLAGCVHCIVVSIQLSVESGCIAIKQLLSLNAAILSGPKKSFLCCQLHRETAEAGVETPSAASSAACDSPMFMKLC